MQPPSELEADDRGSNLQSQAVEPCPLIGMITVLTTQRGHES